MQERFEKSLQKLERVVQAALCNVESENTRLRTEIIALRAEIKKLQSLQGDIIKSPNRKKKESPSDVAVKDETSDINTSLEQLKNMVA